MKKDTTPHGKMVANLDFPAIRNCFDKSPEWSKQLVRLMVANIAVQSVDLDWLATQVKTIIGDEHELLNQIANEVISIEQDTASLDAERDDRTEANERQTNRFYKAQIAAATERLAAAIEKLEQLRAATTLPVS